MTNNTDLFESVTREVLNRSKLGYDRIRDGGIREGKLPPLTSREPGTWLTFSCLTGGLWGPQSEASISACAIRDSYRFGPRDRLVKIWVERPCTKDDDNEDKVFLCILAPETRSLVIKEVQKSLEGEQYLFTGSRVEEDGKRKTTSQRKSMKPRGSQRKTAEVSYAYELVTDEDLDAIYASFLEPESRTTADEVLEKLVHSVRRKQAVGTKEKGLRSRGMEDILGEFWLKMKPLIEEKRFQPQGSKGFSRYVNRCWSTHRANAYRELAKDDAIFESSSSVRSDRSDASGNVLTEASSPEDLYAATLDSSPAKRNALDAQQMVGSLSLKGIDQAIADLYMSGLSQKETAEAVNMSRHQVRRVQQSIKKKMLRANPSLLKAKVA